MSRALHYDLVVALNYYVPYVSGLTEAARMVAEGLAAQGWRVLVVATRHDAALPSREVVNGVHVRRVPVLAQIGKGPISPAFPVEVVRAARHAKVVNLHLPMLEAGLIAAACRTAPVVTTYQCDVSLPASPLNRLQVSLVDASSRLAMRRSTAIGVSSDDYAVHSRLWSAMDGRTHAISPPCMDRSGGSPSMREGPGFHVGFLGRIVKEKGLEYLVEGFRALDDPQARLLIGGDYERVAGGSVVQEVRAAMGDDPRIRLLGFLPDEDLADFYASLDVFALPSVNSLEAFGIVQVEAMMAGVPALSSDLPGVRMPVRLTGFGEVVRPRDAVGVTAALIRMRDHPLGRREGAAAAQAVYGVDAAVAAYADLFESMAAAAHAR